MEQRDTDPGTSCWAMSKKGQEQVQYSWSLASSTPLFGRRNVARTSSTVWELLLDLESKGWTGQRLPSSVAAIHRLSFASGGPQMWYFKTNVLVSHAYLSALLMADELFEAVACTLTENTCTG